MGLKVTVEFNGEDVLALINLIEVRLEAYPQFRKALAHGLNEIGEALE